MAPSLIFVCAILLSPAAFAFGILIVAAVSFIADAWRCHHPAADLLERVESYPSTRIAEEAQWWLDRQRRR